METRSSIQVGGDKGQYSGRWRQGVVFSWKQGVVLRAWQRSVNDWQKTLIFKKRRISLFRFFLILIALNL